MIPATAIRKIYLVIPLIFVSVSAFTQSHRRKYCMSARSRSIHARMRKFLPTGIRGLESRPGNTRGDTTANSTPPLACLPLASILKRPMLRRNVHRVFQSYFASRISKGACWPRKVKDSRPIRPKKIRTRASLRTFTIQTATKLLSGGNNMNHLYRSHFDLELAFPVKKMKGT